MTEKRFTRHKSLDGDCTIYDELNDFQFPSLPHGVSEIFCVKFNELAEENERLKFENETLKSNYQREIQSSIDFCNAYSKTNGELLEEIYQLKQKIEQLKQQCKDFMEMLDDMSIAYLCDEWIYEELEGDLNDRE